jgi:hypothetical protein
MAQDKVAVERIVVKGLGCLHQLPDGGGVFSAGVADDRILSGFE